MKGLKGITQKSKGRRQKTKRIVVTLSLLLLPFALALAAKQASGLLQEGLYAEEVDGDLDAAIAIYEQIINDGTAARSHIVQAMYRQGMCYLKKQQEQQAKVVFGKLVTDYGDQTSIVNKVKPLLDELGDADPAALMPPDTLIYVELGNPGKQIETILKMLKGTPFENPLAAIGNNGHAHQGGMSPGGVVAGFLNPSMMAEFKKIRGVGVGVTGIALDKPPVIVVLFPGKSDALRGLIMAALVMVGKPVEAIEGMQCVAFPHGGGAAYDETVVIVASPTAYSAGQLQWCVKQYKGLTHEPALALSNKSFAKVSKKDRQENALTMWVDVDVVFAGITKAFPEGQIPQEVLAANAFGDFKNMDDLIAFLSIQEDEIALEANVGFKDGHNCLAYNMISTPKLRKDGFKAIPSEAVALLSIGLGRADSVQAQMIREQIKKATGLEIGGDVFANIEQISLFALPVDNASEESLPGVPPIAASLGISLTGPNPQQTRQILTGLLTAANLTVPQSGAEPVGIDGRYRINLVTGQTLHCYIDQANKATILSLNPKIIEASTSTVGSGRSITAAGPLRDAVNDLSPAVSKLVLVNAGGAIQAGGPHFLMGLDDPEGKTAGLLAQLARSCDKTTIQLRTHEELNSFNVRAEINQLPPLDEVYIPAMQLSQAISEAKTKARARAEMARIPATVMQATRPVVIDGVAEDIWASVRRHKLEHAIYSPIPERADLTAYYRAMWDENNLYVLVNVMDDVLKNDSGEFYLDDAVEVFIDADNSKSNSYGANDYQYYFEWAEADPHMGETQHGRTDGIEFAVGRADVGYRVEIKFPWSTLGIEPSAGTKIGLDVHVNDDDDGGDRDTKLTWRGEEDNAWQTPSVLGTAELAGLVGWWKLDEAESETAGDSAGVAHTGKLVGNPHWLPAGGKVNGALEFDGMDDYVDTGYTTNLSTWTVAVWVKSPAAISSEVPTGPVHREKNFQINWNHTMENFRGAAGVCVGGMWYGAGFGYLHADTWYYLVATYDGENLKAYKDAVMITDNSDPSGPPDLENESLKLGRHAVGQDYFRGTIDDVRVYNYALSEEQIKALYEQARQ